jgi:hypothetical protein
MASLSEVLAACVALLPEGFRTDCARLFEPEYLDRLAGRLLELHHRGVPVQPPPPHFAAECTPPLGPVFAYFAEALREWERDPAAPAAARSFAGAVAAAGCCNLLLLLGLRRTPGSLTDARAIPPPRAVLLAAAERACGRGDALSVAARALAKHVHRSPGVFWGKVEGPVAHKNRAARAVVEQVLDQATWWNVFGHYKHDTVFEARVPSGHGARWGRDGTALIGFLEPFETDRWSARFAHPNG